MPKRRIVHENLRTEQLNVRITRQNLELLQRYSDENNTSMTTVINSLIETLAYKQKKLSASKKINLEQ